MPLAPRTLKVRANPWHALDHAGRPCGACPEEHDPQAPRRAFIGARIVATMVRDAKATVAISPDDRPISLVEDAEEHDVRFGFLVDEAGMPAAVDVPNTPYYRRMILDGSLVAADPHTYRAAGGRGTWHGDPAGELRGHAASAADRHAVHYGEEWRDEVVEPLWLDAAGEPSQPRAAEPAPAPKKDPPKQAMTATAEAPKAKE